MLVIVYLIFSIQSVLLTATNSFQAITAFSLFNFPILMLKLIAGFATLSLNFTAKVVTFCVIHKKTIE